MTAIQAQDPLHSHERKLAALSRPVREGDRPKLETFDAPRSLIEIHLYVEQMTSLCPATGRPDYYSVDITLCPNGRCVETHSLNEYLGAFRDLIVSAEVLADLVVRDVLGATGAHWVKVAVHQTNREGIPIDAIARLPIDGE